MSDFEAKEAHHVGQHGRAREVAQEERARRAEKDVLKGLVADGPPGPHVVVSGAKSAHPAPLDD